MHYTYNTDTEDTIPDGLLTGVTMFDGNSISYEYDFLQRLGNRTIAGKLEERYAYAPGAGENTTTTRVSTKHNLWNGSLINQFQYSYDSLGNITSVCDAHTGKRVSYTYDDQGQLLTATHTDNDTITRTEVYTYDNVGNILTFNNGTTSHTYTYGDENWKDLLTAVDGNAITYDASGNPTSYYNGYTMTWVEGRKLDTVTVNGQTYTYIYNADGQRVKKINSDGSFIEYYVMDGITVGESHFTATGNKTLGIRYTLDESGTVVGFTMNGVNYYFAKNLQGDVLAVYNASTNELAAEYTYDSWGNILTATGNLAEINPFRYRGYYYDEETNFYYLQSRYYDASIGRFINADSYASTGQGVIGYNMFAYCNNNPSNAVDPTGHAAHIADRCTFILFDSEEDAAIAAGRLTRMATNRSDNEYICGVYALAHGGYSIGRIYQGEHASVSPTFVLNESRNYSYATLKSMVHSHPYCNGHIPNEFSKYNSYGEVFGDLECAFYLKMPMYLAAPNGDLKVIIPFIVSIDNRLYYSHIEDVIDCKLPTDDTMFNCLY